MKSLLLINYEYPPIGAGAANATYYFAKHLSLKNCNVQVLTSAYKKYRGKNTEDNVLVYRLSACRNSLGKSSLFQMFCFVLSAFFKIDSIIKTNKPNNIIIFFTFPCGLLGLYLKIRYALPYIIMLRGGDVPGFEGSLNLIHTFLTPLRRFIYRKSNCIIANSGGLKDLALKKDPGFTISVITNGVDTHFFKPREDISTVTSTYTFLFAGRICAQKNLETLLKAFAQCISQTTDLHLLLIGDGPLVTYLQKKACKYKVSSFITWKGWCSKKKLRDYYRSSYCFINPSIVEGMSNAVLEAMSCGLPVIGGNCIGNQEIIINDTNGLLFNPSNHHELAEKMMFLYNNRDYGSSLGTKARELCSKQFSWSTITDNLLQLCELSIV